MAIACEAAKSMLEESVRNLVSDALGLPVLSSRSCDDTPLTTAVRIPIGTHAGKKRTAIGKSSNEFLVKNEFVRCRMPGENGTPR